jgi:hypothetical protein
MVEIFEEISVEEQFDVYYEEDIKQLELDLLELC